MNPAKTIKVALAGFGTVGQAVAQLIRDESGDLYRRTGLRFEIVRALVRDRSRPRSVSLPESVLTDDAATLIAADAVMVVELMGGTNAARRIVLGALRAGRDVVTANKALMAVYAGEIYAAARTADRCVAFEASCAGGIPIVGALLHGLAANRIDCIAGILNGTCNYILTEMTDRGRSYADALAEAQKRGYAEADPTLDVDGHDTAHKLAILSSLAFGCDVDAGHIPTEGITGIESTDLTIAGELGFACKLIGVGQRVGGGLDLQVRPMLVPRSHRLAAVGGSANAVCVDGDAVGQVVLSGAGAGGPPTASAVVADMIDTASGAARRTFAQLPVFRETMRPAEYVDGDSARASYYVRINASPTSASTDVIYREFERHHVPIEFVHPKSAHAVIAVITAEVAGSELDAAVSQCCKQLAVKNAVRPIRILSGPGAS